MNITYFSFKSTIPLCLRKWPGDFLFQVIFEVLWITRNRLAPGKSFSWLTVLWVIWSLWSGLSSLTSLGWSRMLCPDFSWDDGDACRGRGLASCGLIPQEVGPGVITWRPKGCQKQREKANPKHLQLCLSHLLISQWPKKWMAEARIRVEEYFASWWEELQHTVHSE